MSVPKRDSSSDSQRIEVPTIDLRKWTAGDEASRAGVAMEFDNAARTVGFLQIINHGVPESVLFSVLSGIDAFFALPEHEKRLVSPPSKSINRGYSSPKSECLALSLSEAAGGAPPALDTFEAFNVGPDSLPDDDDYYSKERDGFFAPNLWPEGLPGFRSAVNAYFHCARQVSKIVTDIFCPALRIENGYFDSMFNKSVLTMRMNNYEPQTSTDGSATTETDAPARMSAHTDYGVVTVLYADPGIPGLQIFSSEDNTWHDIIPQNGALLVNFGDMTAQMTNDRWLATLHRVVPTQKRRRSIAFFFDANYDALMSTVPTCTSAENPPRYEPFVAGEHLLAKVLGPRLLTRSKHDVDTTASRREALRTAGI